jgi:hypothetical protein
VAFKRARKRLRAFSKFRTKSTFRREQGRAKSLDISGKRSTAYRARRLSLISKARILAGGRKQPPFRKKRHSKLTYLKRRR